MDHWYGIKDLPRWWNMLINRGGKWTGNILKENWKSIYSHLDFWVYTNDYSYLWYLFILSLLYTRSFNTITSSGVMTII